MAGKHWGHARGTPNHARGSGGCDGDQPRVDLQGEGRPGVPCWRARPWRSTMLDHGSLNVWGSGVGETAALKAV